MRNAVSAIERRVGWKRLIIRAGAERGTTNHTLRELGGHTYGHVVTRVRDVLSWYRIYGSVERLVSNLPHEAECADGRFEWTPLRLWNCFDTSIRQTYHLTQIDLSAQSIRLE